MDVNIITESIHVSTEYQWRIHEGAWIHKLSLFLNLHLLDIEYEASIEDLLSNGTLASENHYFVVSDLISKTHVTRNPVRFVNSSTSNRVLTSNNFLPHIFRDIIAFNCVNNILLINSTSKCKNEVVLERTQCNS